MRSELDLGLGVHKRVVTAAADDAAAPRPGCRLTIDYEARAGSPSGALLDGRRLALTLPAAVDERVSVRGVGALLLPGVARCLRSLRVGETSDFVVPSDEPFSASVHMRITLVSADTEPPPPPLDFDALALQHREDGNRLLTQAQPDTAAAVAAYEQALACIDKAAVDAVTESVSSAGSADDDSGAAAAVRATLRVVLLSNRAQALLRLARWAEAEASCDAALLADSTHIKTRFRRARARLGAGKLEDARADARELWLLGTSGADERALMVDVGLAHELRTEEEAASLSEGNSEGTSAERRPIAHRRAIAAAGGHRTASEAAVPDNVDDDDEPGIAALAAALRERELGLQARQATAAHDASDTGAAGACGPCLERLWDRVQTLLGCPPPARRRLRRRRREWCPARSPSLRDLSA